MHLVNHPVKLQEICQYLPEYYDDTVEVDLKPSGYKMSSLHLIPLDIWSEHNGVRPYMF